MREPTPQKETETWWRAALAGESLEFTEAPQAGWYWTRMFRGGPRIGVIVFLHSPVDEEGSLDGDEVMYGQQHGKDLVFGEALDELWSKCWNHAVSDVDYNKYLNPDYDPKKDDDNFIPKEVQ